jgi:hypothetical protein
VISFDEVFRGTIDGATQTILQQLIRSTLSNAPDHQHQSESVAAPITFPAPVCLDVILKQETCPTAVRGRTRKFLA